MVTIIDYGVGNLGSIQNMLQRIGVASLVTADPKQVEQAERIILPGIGAFDSAMTKLEQTELPSILRERSAAGIPLLGICLGAQLLTHGSEEGSRPGLGFIDAHCIKFNAQKIGSLKVPQMGWNEVIFQSTNTITDFMDMEIPPRFYFAHSYHMVADQEYVLGLTQYGYNFPTILKKGNILAMQFHPEKSHQYGMQILRNFSVWKP